MTNVEFNYFDYYKRCIEYGWGFNAAAKDVWEKPVLSEEQIASLTRMEAARHPGWQPPKVGEVKPYEKLKAVPVGTPRKSIFDKFRIVA